ncbi:MAG TPA: adenylate/guanylate cyclase domain-containing protein [Thermoleophilaceae bacterium]|nr:adenylate/guanylate cyclase domain-containing protein [Thermoleophilaceae bacterium]
MPPRTRHARHGEARIAYQVVGHGPVDLLVVPGFVSHLGLFWAMPKVAAMFRRLASFSRLILFDKAGTGISDPIAHVPTLEERMDEVHTVLDAAGSERPALLGLSEGGLMSVLFAATYPERTLALALYGAFPCGTYDDALPAELREHAEWLIDEMSGVVEHWGDGRAGDQTSWNLGFFERAAANQAMARGMVEVGRQLDVRPALAAVRVPTVVIHRSDDPFPIGIARWMAERIPGARFAELPGDMHPPWRGDSDSVVDQIEELVTRAPRDRHADRALMTVLSTDVVGGADPTDPALRDALVAEQVQRFRGRPVKGAGNGAFAAFDGPARAIRCAHAITQKADATVDRPMRAGLHTGEVLVMGDDVAGLTVQIAARVAQLARPGEVLVSSGVKNLVVGSGLDFDDRGEHELGGVPGRWALHALQTASDGGLGPAPMDPALATPAVDALTTGERLRLTVARRAPGLGRAASKTLAGVARRRAR